MHGRRNTIAVRPTGRTGLANSTSLLAAMGALAEPVAQSRLVLVCFGSGRARLLRQTPNAGCGSTRSNQQSLL